MKKREYLQTVVQMREKELTIEEGYRLYRSAFLIVMGVDKLSDAEEPLKQLWSDVQTDAELRRRSERIQR